MRAAEGDVLLAKAQDGDPASWSALALLLRRDLDVVAALYAADWAMVEAVSEACWPVARAWINEQRQPQPKAGFLLGATSATAVVMSSLREHALALLRQQLAVYDDQAIAARDVVLHLIAQAALESLPHTADEVPDAAPPMQQRLGRLTQSTQNLLARRYRAGQSSAQIAEEVGHPWDTIAVALAQARSALDWDGAAARLHPSDRQLPLLIEQVIEGNLMGELRSGLAQSLLADLDRTAAFVRQIRLDLVLSALLHTENQDAAALLRERGVQPSSGPKRTATASAAPISERIPTPEPRAPAPARALKARRADTGNTRLWLMLGGGAAVVVVIAAVIVLGRPATTPRPAPTTTVDTPTTPPPGDRPAPPPAAEESFRVEGGQPTVLRAGARQRLQAGAMLRGQESFDTDASVGPVVLALGGGRKLTVGVNSSVTSVSTSGAAEVVVLGRGYARIDPSPGARPVAVRVGTTSFLGDGAAFSLSTIGGGQRVEVARGMVRTQRAGTSFGTVLAGQSGTLNEQGELTVVSAGTFIMGIDLAGNGGVIDGRRWKSQRHAEVDGLSISDATPTTAPLPNESDAALRPLLESGLAGTALRLTQMLPDGTYDVTGWIAGPLGNPTGTLTVTGQSAVETEAVAGDAAKLTASGWRRLWPRRCTVTGGRLSLGFTGKEQQRLSGVMIQAVSAEAGGTATRLPPTVFLDHPFDGLTRTAPLQVTCKAELYAPGEAVRVVEYFANDAKIGEATALPYTFSWPITTPGSYRVTARAVTANGLSATSVPKGVEVRPAGEPVAALPTTADPGAVLPIADFERDAKGWEYVGGWEFPGAAGSSARDAGVVRSGNHAYRLDYDFSGGGAYVGTWAKLEHLTVPDVSELHLWVLAPGLHSLGLRLADGSDQVHQSSLRLQVSNDWQEVVVKIVDAVGGEHWGGANDGKWHKSLKGFGINVGKGNGKTVGTFWLDDIRLRVAP